MSHSSSLAHRADRTPTPSYLWEVPGKPVTVKLAHDLIARLDRDAVENFRSIEARGSEIGGLLYGSMEPGSPAIVSITDFELIPCDYSRGPLYRLSDADTGRFAEAMEKRLAQGGSPAVGFFRSHTRKGLGLDADDVSLLSARFHDPRQIALLVRPFASKASMAGIFIWEDGQMRQDASHLEFPFQSAQLTALAASEPAGALKASPAAPPPARPVTRAQVVPMTSRLKIATPAPPAAAPAVKAAAPAAPAPQPAAPAVQPAAPPPVAEKPAPPAAPPPERAERAAMPAREPDLFSSVTAEPLPASSRRNKLIWLAAGAALLACSGVLFVYPGLARHSSRPTLPSAVPLTLRVERTATDLVLTWNRDSDAIRNARRAVLSISDGDRQENVEMNLADLRNGSIMYSPLTADTSFRMETTGPDGSKTATESVRVLRTKPSAMPADSKPGQPERTAPAAQATQNAAAQPPAEEEPAPVKRQARAFNVASLSQRLRPAPAAAEVPDAPLLASGPAAAVSLGAVAPSKLTPLNTPAATPAQPEPAPPAGGGLVPSKLVSRVDPVYPVNARRMTGEVRVSAIIGMDGKVKSAKAVSGPMELQRAAADAVQRWIYTPTMLNGKQIEAEREIVITFAPR